MTEESASTVSDSFTRSGATRLARDVERFWKAKGAKITAWVEDMEDPRAGRIDQRKRLYCVRSDLVRGLPRADGVTV